MTKELGEEFQFNELLAVGEPRKSVVGYNIHEDWDRCQPGGTAAMVTGRLSNYVLKCEPDETGLGRWVHIELGTPEKKVHFVFAYCPCYKSSLRRRGKGRKGMSVYEQQDRYWRRRGELNQNPIEMFEHDLLTLIRGWRAVNEDVILGGDLNKDIYQGLLAKALRGDDIMMTEQFDKLLGQEAPFSHKSGKKPISGCFASPGAECTAAFISAHDAGVGDHCLHVYDFSAISLLGTTFPTTEKPSGRKLRCDLE